MGDLDVCSIDGSLTRVPDSGANREAYGSAGTADDSSPYPQVRELRLSHASTRAMLAVVTGPSGAAAGGSRGKGEAEQALLDRALKDYPAVFTPERIWVMDRNFRAWSASLAADGTHEHERLSRPTGSGQPSRSPGARLRWPQSLCSAGTARWRRVSPA